MEVIAREDVILRALAHALLQDAQVIVRVDVAMHVHHVEPPVLRLVQIHVKKVVKERVALLVLVHVPERLRARRLVAVVVVDAHLDAQNHVAVDVEPIVREVVVWAVAEAVEVHAAMVVLVDAVLL